MTHSDSYMSHLSTSYRPCLITNYVPTYFIISWHIIQFFPQISGIQNSSLRIPSNLTQPVRHVKSFLQLVPALTCPNFIFVKRIKPKSAMIHLWLQKKTFTFCDLGPFLTNGISLIYKNSPHLIHTAFQKIFKLRLAESLIQHFLSKWPPYCQEVRVLNYLPQYVPRTSFSPNPIHLLPNFQLNVM